MAVGRPRRTSTRRSRMRMPPPSDPWCARRSSDRRERRIGDRHRTSGPRVRGDRAPGHAGWGVRSSSATVEISGAASARSARTPRARHLLAPCAIASARSIRATSRATAATIGRASDAGVVAAGCAAPARRTGAALRRRTARGRRPHARGRHRRRRLLAHRSRSPPWPRSTVTVTTSADRRSPRRPIARRPRRRRQTPARGFENEASSSQLNQASQSIRQRPRTANVPRDTRIVSSPAIVPTTSGSWARSMAIAAACACPGPVRIRSCAARDRRR